MKNSNLKLPFLEEDIESLHFDEIPKVEGSAAAKKLILIFHNRRDEIKQLLQDQSLSKEAQQELRLELRMLNTSIKKEKNF